MDEYKKIVEYARKKYPQAESIVSAYTMDIIWTNKKLADVSGYSQEELVDKNIRDVIEIDSSTLMSLITGRDAETQVIRTKSGKRIKGTTAIRMMMYDNEPYFVTYGSSFEPLEKK